MAFSANEIKNLALIELNHETVTDWTDASWATINALQNTATGSNSLTILGTVNNRDNIVALGVGSNAAEANGVSIGYNSYAYANSVALGYRAIAGDDIFGTRGVAIGYNAAATGKYSLAIGREAKATAQGSIQISVGSTSGSETNSDANTFKIANANGNFELMDANGYIPAARLKNAATSPATMPTLAVADWSSNTQTVTVSGVTATNTVFVSPAPASAADYAAALVFDQIGTITVNGTNYIRQGKCNETGYYAWQKATSNITVGGTVYTFDITQITRNTNPNTKGDILYGWTNGSTTIYTNSLKPQIGDYIWTAFNVAQSTTPVDAVDNEFVYTVDSAEPAVSDTVYSDATGTVLGTISSIA